VIDAQTIKLREKLEAERAKKQGVELETAKSKAGALKRFF
jgi:hypothetical protein